MQGVFAFPAQTQTFGPGAVLLRGFAHAQAERLIDAIPTIIAQSPWRNYSTPGGKKMSAAMSACGTWGWVSDAKGYRYERVDPQSGKPWPAMPETFQQLAQDAAKEAGFDSFIPDTCLVNRYVPGAKLSMHQDHDEEDFGEPIVSVSLGLSARFLWGGPKRNDKATGMALDHGDVFVFGGPARLNYHAIAPLKEGEHPLSGACRINLTFRRARA